jgi:hypothetical protein
MLLESAATFSESFFCGSGFPASCRRRDPASEPHDRAGRLFGISLVNPDTPMSWLCSAGALASGFAGIGKCDARFH